MKNLLDYIYNELSRVLSMLGINLDAFQSLTAQVEKAQNTHQNEREAEKIRIKSSVSVKFTPISNGYVGHLWII